jgi:hypothetical protein
MEIKLADTEIRDWQHRYCFLEALGRFPMLGEHLCQTAQGHLKKQALPFTVQIRFKILTL